MNTGILLVVFIVPDFRAISIQPMSGSETSIRIRSGGLRWIMVSARARQGEGDLDGFICCERSDFIPCNQAAAGPTAF
jgi:hypothetical protein